MTQISADAIAPTDVAIIGGGMVGVTAALMLAQALPGKRIRLLERFALNEAAPYQASFDQRATAIAAGSFEALGSLDLLPQLKSLSGKITCVQVSDRGHWGHAVIDASEHGLDALGWVVPNAALGQCLLHKLAQTPAIECLAPVEVLGLQARADGFSVTSSQGNFHAGLVILADGAEHSAVKKSLGLVATHNRYQQQAVIANVQTELPHLGRAFERFTDWGPMALLPLVGSCEMALVWTLNDAHAAIADADDAHFLAQLQSRFGDRLGRFVRVGKRDTYPLALVQAREQVRSHLLLLGNAAHFLHPVAGQGFNLSVRDIQCLARVLATHAGPLGSLAQLEHYLALRQKDQWLTTEYSHQLVQWFSSSDWLNVLPRQLGLMLLQAMPGLKQGIAQQSLGRSLINRPTGPVGERAL